MRAVDKATGIRISTHRVGLGLSQNELARRLGTRQCTVSLLELGEQHLKAPMIVALCRVLGISSDYLLGITQPGLNGPDPSLMADARVGRLVRSALAGETL
jgi:transcriptional regulator with XRE-family HTH domain